jgi:hypothetical protein
LHWHQNQSYSHQNQNNGGPKIETNQAMPKTIGLLYVRCKKVMGKVSPMVPPHPSDDEASMGGETIVLYKWICASFWKRFEQS